MWWCLEEILVPNFCRLCRDTDVTQAAHVSQRGRWREMEGDSREEQEQRIIFVVGQYIFREKRKEKGREKKKKKKEKK
jgi:hypothetical protein